MKVCDIKTDDLLCKWFHYAYRGLSEVCHGDENLMLSVLRLHGISDHEIILRSTAYYNNAGLISYSG